MIRCHHANCDHTSENQSKHFHHWNEAHLQEDLEQKARMQHGNAHDDYGPGL